jgi:hypothetical protein
MGLVIRLCSFKSWQEGVVNVNYSAIKGLAKGGAKNLHIPGEQKKIYF